MILIIAILIAGVLANIVVVEMAYKFKFGYEAYSELRPAVKAILAIPWLLTLGFLIVLIFTIVEAIADWMDH